ncbi:MAG: carbohydrate ABC transporter permease [Ruminococcaceae bacterium]|nr:carbohydrate ABC transporter permease [Oscillospiraceae bacterium]
MFINRMKNEGTAYGVFKVFNGIVMVAVILITLIPYLNVLAKSINDGVDSMRGGIFLWPRVFTLENYKVLLNDSSMYRATLVTIAKVVLQVTGSILLQFTAAYALSRRELWGLKAINIFFLVPMYIGGGLIASYILFSYVGLLNNFWVYVIPCIWNFYNVIIIRSYMESNIPDAVIEAARIDGAQEWTLFSRIVLPLCKPILATIVLWVAVGAWNEWTTTLYYIQNPDLYTLQYKLMQTLKESERIRALMQQAVESGKSVEEVAQGMKVTTDSMQSAQIIIVTLPIIAVYPFLQKHFVKGVTLGSVKG